VDTDEKTTPLWLRLCGGVVGAILTALGGAALFFIGGVSGAFSGEFNVTLFIGSFACAGAFLGFLLPRHTMAFLLPALEE
jgi:hypothetical protein